MRGKIAFAVRKHRDFRFRLAEDAFTRTYAHDDSALRAGVERDGKKRRQQVFGLEFYGRKSRKRRFDAKRHGKRRFGNNFHPHVLYILFGRVFYVQSAYGRSSRNYHIITDGFLEFGFYFDLFDVVDFHIRILVFSTRRPFFALSSQRSFTQNRRDASLSVGFSVCFCFCGGYLTENLYTVWLWYFSPALRVVVGYDGQLGELG